MATKTGGTLTTTTLTGVQFSHDPNALSNADFATIANGICWDTSAQGNNIGAIMPGAFTRVGNLYLPTGLRNLIEVRNGKDWVFTDGYGNVIYVPQRACPKTLTGTISTTNGSNTITSTTNINTYGWQVGTHITGTNIPAGSVISSIAPGGLSFTIAAFSTGAAANCTGTGSVTATAGTFTHS